MYNYPSTNASGVVAALSAMDIQKLHLYNASNLSKLYEKRVGVMLVNIKRSVCKYVCKQKTVNIAEDGFLFVII